MSSLLFSTVEPNKDNPSKKNKILVVDDEQDNLDLLYRTFRREFVVFRASSGLEALEILAKEGEMAAIISDQRMPEMKGTEFLSRTISDFPDTMRIVLTGYTDITDLIEAINSGQVHKYITKPWEPEKLKSVILEAAQNYDLLKQRCEQLRRSQAQNSLLSLIGEMAQKSNQLSDCVFPLTKAFQENFGADGVLLQLVENDEIIETQAICGDYPENLATNSLVREAIASKKSQILLDQSDSDQPQKTNIAIAIIFREEVLAILSMVWLSPNTFDSDNIASIQQCAKTVAIALTCIRDYEKS